MEPEVVGYLYNGDYICRECVEDEFADDMETFWADEPVPYNALQAVDWRCQHCQKGSDPWYR